MPGPEYLVEDRPTHSIDEIDDVGESKTMEGYDDGCLMCRQESERGDPYGGDSEDISPYIRPSGDGSLDKVGSDDDDSGSEAMMSQVKSNNLAELAECPIVFFKTHSTLLYSMVRHLKGWGGC